MHPAARATRRFPDARVQASTKAHSCPNRRIAPAPLLQPARSPRRGARAYQPECVPNWRQGASPGLRGRPARWAESRSKAPPPQCLASRSHLSPCHETRPVRFLVNQTAMVRLLLVTERDPQQPQTTLGSRSRRRLSGGFPPAPFAARKAEKPLPLTGMRAAAAPHMPNPQLWPTPAPSRLRSVILRHANTHWRTESQNPSLATPQPV
mmetsp:Transcript_48324/g.134975  ORF Transcript_48324/g.134975 Transcript_48324/m.134975 type:complete len:208 (-) Transcript_48324:398-1021(-)